MKPNIKSILIFVGIFALLVGGYFIFFNKSATKPALVSNTTGKKPVNNTQANANVVGQEFLSQLLNVNSLQLDTSIFTSNSFNSLKDTTDNSLTLSSLEDKGRVNPFSPTESGSVAPAPTPLDTANTLNSLEVTNPPTEPGAINPPANGAVAH